MCASAAEEPPAAEPGEFTARRLHSTELASARRAGGERTEREPWGRGAAGVLRPQRQDAGEDAGRRAEDGARAGKAPGAVRPPARGLSSRTVFHSGPTGNAAGPPLGPG